MDRVRVVMEWPHMQVNCMGQRVEQAHSLAHAVHARCIPLKQAQKTMLPTASTCYSSRAQLCLQHYHYCLLWRLHSTVVVFRILYCTHINHSWVTDTIIIVTDTNSENKLTRASTRVYYPEMLTASYFVFPHSTKIMYKWGGSSIRLSQFLIKCLTFRWQK